jgi:hypothetical protein
VSDSFSGLRIVDSSIDSSRELITLSVNPRTVAETEDVLFVAGNNQGLLILDKKSIQPRQVVETINTPGNVHDLFIRGHWMYVANARSGVSLHNLENYAAVFPLVTTRRSESFAATDKYLFIAQGKLGVEVVDISQPNVPKSLNIWSDLPAVHVAVTDHYLVVSNGAYGLTLVDISDISHPVVADRLTAVHPLDIAVEEGLIYVASKLKGLLIYAIDSDSTFDHVGDIKTPFPMSEFAMTMGVKVEKGIAYIANGRAGMLIADIGNPRQPVLLSSVDIPGVSKAISIVGHQVFVVSHRGGINIFDVTDPKIPVLKNRIKMLGLSRGIQIVDDLIYVTHRAVGVTVIPVPVAGDIRERSKHHMRVCFPSPQFSGRYSLQVANGHELVARDGSVTYR